MSDDAYGVEPVPPSRPEPPRRERDPDDVDYRLMPEAPYPATVKAAGVIWIVYGCLVLLSSLANLAMTLGASANAGGGAAAATGGLCGQVLPILFGVAFLFVGVQSVRGTAKDTLGNGIGSIIFSVLQFGGAAMIVFFFLPGVAAAGVGAAAAGTLLFAAGVVGLTGVLLLTAGVLALVGRSAYRDWKRAQWMQQDREAAERRERRRDYPG